MMIRKRGPLVGIALFALLLVAACGAPDATPTPEPPASTPTLGAPTATPTPALSAFEVEWEALKVAARAEGKLQLVSGNSSSRALVPPVREIFGEQFGIDVTITGGSGSQHAPRIAAERQAGRYEVDVVILGRSTVGPRLAEPGFMTPINAQLIHPDVLDLSKWFGGKLWYREPDGVEPKYSLAFAVKASRNPIEPTYNTELVTEADVEALNSVWDFLDDKWKGQIIALSPLDTGASGTIHVVYAHPEMGPEWLARFYDKEFGVTFVSDVRTIVDSISLGGHAFSIFDQGASSQILLLKNEGLPVDLWSKNLKEGGVFRTTSSLAWIGMMDRAPNPNASKLFLNWFLSQEGQTAYQTMSSSPPNPSLRLDVPPGETLPQERIEPGVTYEMASLDTSLPDLRAEAIEFAQRMFLER